MGVELVEFATGFSCYSAIEEAFPSAEEEIRFVYKEIFEDHCYDVAKIPEDAFIIDAGANIGLFSLYMKQKCPSSKILAFEPAPQTVEILRQNLALHQISGVEVHSYALGSKASTQTFTYYPHMPADSTLVPAEKDKLRPLFTRELGRERADKMYLDVEEVPVQTRPLSLFLDACANLEKIDLLKIDVEGAELEVLRGINDNHWQLIRNVSMEMCDLSGDLEEVEHFLQAKGLVVKSEPTEWGPRDAKFYMVEAHRAAS